MDCFFHVAPLGLALQAVRHGFYKLALPAFGIKNDAFRFRPNMRAIGLVRLLEPPRRVFARDRYKAQLALRVAPDQQAAQVAPAVTHHHGRKLRRGGHFRYPVPPHVWQVMISPSTRIIPSSRQASQGNPLSLQTIVAGSFRLIPTSSPYCIFPQSAHFRESYAELYTHS